MSKPDTTYNPMANWSEDDLIRSLSFNNCRVRSVRRELDGLLRDDAAIRDEMVRREVKEQTP